MGKRSSYLKLPVLTLLLARLTLKMRSIINFFRSKKQEKNGSENTGNVEQKKVSKPRKGSFKKIIDSAGSGSSFKKISKKPTIDDYHISTIRLFKALQVSTKRKKKHTKTIIKETVDYGFIFSPEVVNNFSEKELSGLSVLIKSEVGISPEEMNSSFHKSWKKIKEASIQTLVLEQLIHYFTTYGLELFGAYSPDSVFIPAEKLEIPYIDLDNIKLAVIRGYTRDEIKEKVISLLKSGVALGEDTIKGVLNVCFFLDVDKSIIADVKNREVKIALSEFYNIFPKEPIEFLRYLLYKTIQKTLLIKDAATIEAIKENADAKLLRHLLVRYHKKYGIERLGQIFLRFKPLFLAFRVDDDTKTIVNRIRKYASEHHIPLKEDYLNTVTAMIKNGVKINKDELIGELGKVNTFRKIRLAYALKYRAQDVDSILYKIRNGRGFASEFNFEQKKEAKRVYEFVKESIIQDISRNVKGKKIYIPDNMRYTLPATEKQFTDKFPNGTCVSIPKDMIFGVHWKNVGIHRVDLDLSMVNVDKKIGWDAAYRNEGRSILFSGDMTDAPGKGATELFYVKRQHKDSYIILLNYFNYKEVEVPFKIIVAEEQASDFGKNYMVNPNNIETVAKSKTKHKQKVLGLLVTTTNESKFYFAETYLGRSISSRCTDHANNAKKYLLEFFTRAITLNKVLESAGAILVKEQDGCDIDLSPENLEKDTILKLIC